MNSQAKTLRFKSILSENVEPSNTNVLWILSFSKQSTDFDVIHGIKKLRNIREHSLLNVQYSCLTLLKLWAGYFLRFLQLRAWKISTVVAYGWSVQMSNFRSWSSILLQRRYLSSPNVGTWAIKSCYNRRYHSRLGMFTQFETRTFK